jgi:hypothetical protein
MNKKYRTSVILVVVCVLFLSACGNEGNAGYSGSETNNVTIVDAEDCLDVKLEKIEPGYSSVNLVGTVKNNCDSPVSMAVIKSYCYTSAGESIGPDLVSVNDLAVGEKEDFDALIATVHIDPKTITKCTQEIRDAFYDN